MAAVQAATALSEVSTATEAVAGIGDTVAGINETVAGINDSVAGIGEVVETVGEQVVVATDAASTAVSAAETATTAAQTATTQVTSVFNFQQVRDSYADPNVLTANATTIMVAPHSRHYLGTPDPVAVNAGEVGGLAAAIDHHVFYVDPTFAGGAVTYQAATTIENALASLDNPARHYVGAIRTAATGTTVVTVGTPGPGLPSWKREQLNLNDE